MGNDSRVEMNGTMLQLLLNGCGLLQPRVWNKLVEIGFTDIAADAWYPTDDVMQVLNEVVQVVGENGFTVVGQRVMLAADCLPDGCSFEEALFSLDRVYKQAHANGLVGSVQVEEVEPQRFQVRADTPYPPLFTLGILRGLCRRYIKLARIESLASNWRSGEFLIHW